MMLRSEKFARPAFASLPDAPAPYTAVWLTPQLNDSTSMCPGLLVLGPSTPSTYKYAFTATSFSFRVSLGSWLVVVLEWHRRRIYFAGAGKSATSRNETV